MKGFSIYEDFVDCSNIITGDELLKVASEAVEKANMQVVNRLYENFPEHIHKNEYGDSVLTLIIPLEQSHCIIHTWPAYKLVSIDIYTCGAQANARKAVEYLADIFKPKSRHGGEAVRGI